MSLQVPPLTLTALHIEMMSMSDVQKKIPGSHQSIDNGGEEKATPMDDSLPHSSAAPDRRPLTVGGCCCKVGRVDTVGTVGEGVFYSST